MATGRPPVIGGEHAGGLVVTLKFAARRPMLVRMSIDAAISRIQTILQLQQQLFDPSTSASTSSPVATANAAASATAAQTLGTGASGTGAGTFASALASAQTTAATPSTGGAAIDSSGYVNPLANATVRGERIDQGVDYAGSGTLGALGPGVVTKVVQTGSGWEGGGYVEYKLTGGPYAGHSVYYAEGVTPTVSVGQTLTAGQPVATIINGFPTGMELGFAAGNGSEESYANVYGGGYTEGTPTAAGQAFSNLVASLGGPAGTSSASTPSGTFR
jgi:hypothetical protein